MARWRALLLLSLLLPLPLPAAQDCSDLSGLPILRGVLWEDVWNALDQQSSCTQNCHLGSAPAGDLDLSSRQLAIYFLVGQLSAQSGEVQRVVAGDPQRSLLFQKVACAQPDVGQTMPPGGHLPGPLQELIHDWIAAGAYGESAEDPIPRDFIFRDSLESLRGAPLGPSANTAAHPTHRPERGDRS
jgi:hypothetical protein